MILNENTHVCQIRTIEIDYEKKVDNSLFLYWHVIIYPKKLTRLYNWDLKCQYQTLTYLEVPRNPYHNFLKLSSVFFNFVVSTNLTLLIAFGQTIKLVELF